MRHLFADLTGRTALLTGARVKIGFEIGLKLLRAGATLIATTRFPADAAARYAREKDYDEWKHRLHVHAVDLRDVAGLEAFCARLLETTPRLDVIVNNACQTVRRPATTAPPPPRGASTRGGVARGFARVWKPAASKAKARRSKLPKNPRRLPRRHWPPRRSNAHESREVLSESTSTRRPRPARCSRTRPRDRIRTSSSRPPRNCLR